MLKRWRNVDDVRFVNYIRAENPSLQCYEYNKWSHTIILWEINEILYSQCSDLEFFNIFEWFDDSMDEFSYKVRWCQLQVLRLLMTVWLQCYSKAVSENKEVKNVSVEGNDCRLFQESEKQLQTEWPFRSSRNSQTRCNFVTKSLLLILPSHLKPTH